MVNDSEYLNALCCSLGEQTKTRITIVNSSGIVLGDSHESPIIMDNHNDRPEIIAAINNKIGTAKRYSYTLEKDMLYLAIPYKKNNQRLIIRTSLPASSLEDTLMDLRSNILIGGLIILLFGTMVSYIISKKIVNPIVKLKQEAKRISEGDFSKKIYIAGTKEFVGLTDALNMMAKQLEERIRAITTQANEQVAILSSMIEGIIAIDNNTNILRINSAAEKLFGIVGQSVIGKPLSEVVRNSILLEYVAEILTGGKEIQREISVRIAGDRNILIHNAQIIGEGNISTGATFSLHRYYTNKKVRAHQ